MNNRIFQRVAAVKDLALRFVEDSDQSGTLRQSCCREADAEYQYTMLRFLFHFAEEFRSFPLFKGCPVKNRQQL